MKEMYFVSYFTSKLNFQPFYPSIASCTTPGMSVPCPSKETLRREDKDEEPGRVTMLEMLGKIHEQVGIYEQVGRMKESGEYQNCVEMTDYFTH